MVLDNLRCPLNLRQSLAEQACAYDDTDYFEKHRTIRINNTKPYAARRPETVPLNMRYMGPAPSQYPAQFQYPPPPPYPPAHQYLDHKYPQPQEPIRARGSDASKDELELDQITEHHVLLLSPTSHGFALGNKSWSKRPVHPVAADISN